jgi:tRNA nucleotidyltransferase/poly(A) polymerase
LSLPSLAGEPWLEAPEVRAVFAALGGEERATRVVGGAVRNALLGQPVTDIDFATILVPAEVTARAEAAGLKTVPTGIDHGTVTLVVGGRPFEVTTLRADVETFGRRAVVRFTGDWAEDAKRRDFTINALYCDADGTIFDPLGAYADIASRRVRFIGSADERIREDYLRILRFFRFFAWYGVGRPDAAGLKAAARHKAGLALLSAERLWAELKKLLAAPDPSRALLWMRTTDILQRVLPESWGIDAIHRLVAAEAAEGRAPDPLLRLEAIMPPHRARIDSLAGRLRLSRAEEARLLEWATDRLPPRQAALPLGDTRSPRQTDACPGTRARGRQRDDSRRSEAADRLHRRLAAAGLPPQGRRPPGERHGARPAGRAPAQGARATLDRQRLCPQPPRAARRAAVGLSRQAASGGPPLDAGTSSTVARARSRNCWVTLSPCVERTWPAQTCRAWDSVSARAWKAQPGTSSPQMMRFISASFRFSPGEASVASARGR